MEPDQGSQAPGRAIADASGTVATPDADGAGSDAATTIGVTDAARPDGGVVPYHAIAVATGWYHTCAILDDHHVKCWGHNELGQLGLGDTKDRGADSSTMGNNLPIVDLGTGRTATAIRASRYTSCAILDDQTVKCWGDFIGDEPMGDKLPALDFSGRKAHYLAMGPEGDACASMSDDTVWCWEAPPFAPRQMSGLPAKHVIAVSPGGGGVNVPNGGSVVVLYDDGTVWIPGGTVPLFTSDRKIVAVAESPGNGTCFLLDDGTTTCIDGSIPDGPDNAVAIGNYGSTLCSAFSDGSVSCQSVPCAAPYQCTTDGSFSLGSPVLTVTSNGSDFACALLGNGDIKCWADYPTSLYLGAEFDVLATQPDGAIVYGPWRAVDLGTH